MSCYFFSKEMTGVGNYLETTSRCGSLCRCERQTCGRLEITLVEGLTAPDSEIQGSRAD